MALTREQDRERQRRRRAAMTDDERDLERAKARERMAALRRLDPERFRERDRNRKRTYRAKPNALSLSERGRLGAKARWASRTPAVRHLDPVPAEVRAAYGRAHPNSVIRRKYPTWAALRRAWS